MTDSKAILDGTWGRIANAAVADHRLPDAAIRVLCAFGRFADHEGTCWPSLRRIAEIVGTKPRQVRRHLRLIESLGYVTRLGKVPIIDKKGQRLGGHTYAYRLNFPEPPKLSARLSHERDDAVGYHPSGVRSKLTSTDDGAIEACRSWDDRQVRNGSSKRSRAVGHLETAIGHGKALAVGHGMTAKEPKEEPNKKSLVPRARAREADDEGYTDERLETELAALHHEDARHGTERHSASSQNNHVPSADNDSGFVELGAAVEAVLRRHLP